MSKDLWWKGLSSKMTDEKNQNFYQACQDYIVNNKYNIMSKVHGRSVSSVLEKMLVEFEEFDIVEIIKYLDLKESLKIDAFASLLFGFHENRNSELNKKLMEFVLENFAVIKEHYGEQRYNDMRPYNYIRNEGWFVPTEYISQHNNLAKIVALKYKPLTHKKVNMMLKSNHPSTFASLQYSLHTLDESSRSMIESDKNYVRFLRGESTIDLNVSHITIEKLDELVKIMTNDERTKLMRSVELHKHLNSEGPYYHFMTHMYYNDLTQPIVAFYIDYFATQMNTDFHANNRHSIGMFEDILQFIYTKIDKNDWVEAEFIKCLDNPILLNKIVWHINHNPSLRLFNILVTHKPEVALTQFDHKKFIIDILVSENNKSFNLGW